MDEPLHDAGRRRFLEVAVYAGAAGVAGTLGAPAGWALLWPVGRTTVREGDGFVDVGAVADLPEDRPVRVVLRADRQDAYLLLRDVELGSAWLLRRPGGAVDAFSASCPHLGCTVDHADSRRQFECPCHDSAFAESGAVLKGPARRPLDRLATRMEAGRLLLRFERFAAGAGPARRA